MHNSFGFIIDPIDGFDPERETTLFLMHEAQKRKYKILTFTLSDLFYQSGSVFGKAKEIKVEKPSPSKRNRKPFYNIIRESTVDLTSLNAIFLRKDPPTDLNYFHHLYLLETIQDRVPMINSPRGILKVQEKIYPLRFEKYIPQTCITKKLSVILEFIKTCPSGVVLKPLNSSGGRGVFSFRGIDSNLAVAVETLTHEGKEDIICQEYLPQVSKGDKRVMLLNGEILGYFLRVPQKGDHRANLHSGGNLTACQLSKKEKMIALEVGEVLKKEGLTFVGLDMIGEKLTEINVTSPMGLREINLTMGGQSEKKVIDFVEGEFTNR